MIEQTHAELEDLCEKRDQRIVQKPPKEECKVASLNVWLKSKLRSVAAPNILVDDLIKLAGRRPDRVLTCGRRDGPYFVRVDGLRCSFEFIVQETDADLTLISYVMTMVSPESSNASPRFLRWEYSCTRKPNVNAQREPLAHLHPGHNDVRLPAPVLTPRELIAVFLGLRAWWL